MFIRAKVNTKTQLNIVRVTISVIVIIVIDSDVMQALDSGGLKYIYMLKPQTYCLLLIKEWYLHN